MKAIRWKVATMAVLLNLCSALSWAGPDQVPEPPETIIMDGIQELYQPVTFDHAMHQDTTDCTTCHHQTLGTIPKEASCRRCHATSGPPSTIPCSGCHGKTGPGSSDGDSSKKGAGYHRYHIDIPDLKGALHLRCRGCHTREGGPTGCQDCHGFTEAGRQRFGLIQTP